jgi:hypothetical protein
VLKTRLVAFQGSSFLLRAGVGAFVCSITAGPDPVLDQRCVCVSAHTWIHADQIAESQPFASSSPIAGEQLGNTLLLPIALRHWLKVRDNAVRVRHPG